jgi:hypothetical protein
MGADTTKRIVNVFAVFVGVLLLVWFFVWACNSPKVAAPLPAAPTSVIQQQPLPAIKPPPPPPPKPVHFTAPTSGADSEFTMMMGNCERLSDRIECSGMIKNTTDAPSLVYLMDSTAVDDEGRSFFLGSFLGSNIRFDQGTMEKLMPNVNTRFIVDVPDAHENVKAVNLQINTQWGEGERPGHVIFENIPVQ